MSVAKLRPSRSWFKARDGRLEAPTLVQFTQPRSEHRFDQQLNCRTFVLELQSRQRFGGEHLPPEYCRLENAPSVKDGDPSVHLGRADGDGQREGLDVAWPERWQLDRTKEGFFQGVRFGHNHGQSVAGRIRLQLLGGGTAAAPPAIAYPGCSTDTAILCVAPARNPSMQLWPCPVRSRREPGRMKCEGACSRSALSRTGVAAGMVEAKMLAPLRSRSKMFRSMLPGIDLNTNDFDLDVNGLVQLTGSSTNLIVGGADSLLTADGITINNLANVELNGGTIQINEESGNGLLDINAGGELVGHGTLSMTDAVAANTTLIVNDGAITARRAALVIFGAAAGWHAVD